MVTTLGRRRCRTTTTRCPRSPRPAEEARSRPLPASGRPTFSGQPATTRLTPLALGEMMEAMLGRPRATPLKTTVAAAAAAAAGTGPTPLPELAKPPRGLIQRLARRSIPSATEAPETTLQ